MAPIPVYSPQPIALLSVHRYTETELLQTYRPLYDETEEFLEI